MRNLTFRGAATAVLAGLLFATPAITQITPAGSATPPQPVRWQFAPDLRSHPNRNPFSSYLGGPEVWSLRQSKSLQHDANYTLLPRYSSTFGSAGIKAWHGDTQSCVSLPAIGVNTNKKSAPLCNGTVPGKAAFARPTATRMAVIAWTSPFDGKVTISHDAIADVDPTCGDGITYYVELGTRRLSTTRLANRDALTLAQRTQHIRRGQSLYFIVDAGPNGDFGCDTTQLQITIDRVVT